MDKSDKDLESASFLAQTDYDITNEKEYDVLDKPGELC